MAEPAKVDAPTKAKAKPRPAPKRRRKTKRLPPFNVVLLDDDQHTYEYVIAMLRSLFGHSEERAYQMAKEVDATGRVIVYTSHRELAELKREQIHSWGADPRISTCRGAMSSIIEPAN